MQKRILTVMLTVLMLTAVLSGCGFNNIFEEKTLNNIAKTVKKGFLD